MAWMRSGAVTDWRHRQMAGLCRKWGWSDAEIRLLDTRPEWKLERVVDERNAWSPSSREATAC